MTREEVNQHLEKSPLRWEGKGLDTVAYVNMGDMPIMLHYILRGDCLYLSLFVNGEVSENFIGQYEDAEYLKYAAEAHRLDIICQLLGITE